MKNQIFVLFSAGAVDLSNCASQAANIPIPVTSSYMGARLGFRINNEEYPIDGILNFVGQSSLFGTTNEQTFTSMTIYPDNEQDGYRDGPVEITENNPGFYDPVHYGDRPSMIAMGRDSPLMQQMGPLAVIRSPNDKFYGDFILRSSRAFFVASCFPGSIMSIPPTANVSVVTVEDRDAIVDSPTAFGFAGNWNFILSLPQPAYRRYIQKMIALGATEQNVDPRTSMFERVLYMDNCTEDLVAQLPSIRVQFSESMYMEFEAKELITVVRYPDRCILEIDFHERSQVYLNPLRVPFMNARSAADGTVMLCDSFAEPGRPGPRRNADIMFQDDNSSDEAVVRDGIGWVADGGEIRLAPEPAQGATTTVVQEAANEVPPVVGRSVVRDGIRWVADESEIRLAPEPAQGATTTVVQEVANEVPLVVERSILRRGLGMLRCAFRALGCRPR